MSYQGVESSIQGGSPVELYAFTRGTQRYLYTTDTDDVVYNAESYAASHIERDGIEASDEINRQNLTIRLAAADALVADFVAAVTSAVTTLTIYRYHRGDGETIAFWKGRITGVTFTDDVAELRCEPVFTSLMRIGIRAHYQLLCRHVLYGSDCDAPEAAFKVSGTITAVTGATLTVDTAATKPDGWFVGGRIAVNGLYRMITSHAGETIILAAPILGLAVGASCDMSAGCKHDMPDCRDKFNNLCNFGGFPYIPKKNPFSGDAIV